MRSFHRISSSKQLLQPLLWLEHSRSCWAQRSMCQIAELSLKVHAGLVNMLPNHWNVAFLP
jgi:hypothetical protein